LNYWRSFRLRSAALNMTSVWAQWGATTNEVENKVMVLQSPLLVSSWLPAGGSESLADYWTLFKEEPVRRVAWAFFNPPAPKAFLRNKTNGRTGFAYQNLRGLTDLAWLLSYFVAAPLDAPWQYFEKFLQFFGWFRDSLQKIFNRYRV